MIKVLSFGQSIQFVKRGYSHSSTLVDRMALFSLRLLKKIAIGRPLIIRQFALSNACWDLSCFNA
jgi:hypothetical protein